MGAVEVHVAEVAERANLRFCTIDTAFSVTAFCRRMARLRPRLSACEFLQERFAGGPKRQKPLPSNRCRRGRRGGRGGGDSAVAAPCRRTVHGADVAILIVGVVARADGPRGAAAVRRG